MTLESVLGEIARGLSRQDKLIEDLNRKIVNNPLNAGKASPQTIAAGVISVTRPHVVVLPESGTTDNLDEIDNFADGKMIVISTADPGDTITVRDESVSGGNIALRGVTSRVLSDPEDSLILVYKESVGFWLQAGGIPSGGSPGAHASTHQHGGSDEVATATSAANAIPKAGADGKIGNDWLDIELAAIAGLTSAADQLPYFTGSGTAALTTLTSFARTLVDDVDAATMRATLGLVIGTNVQAFDATLLSIAALGTVADRIAYTTGVDTWAETPITAFGRSLIDDAAASDARTTLGLVAGGAGDIWVEKAGDTMAGALDFASTFFIVNLPDPVSAQDAATKAYVDATIQGLDVKQSVRVATTANITLSAPQTIDGVSVIAGDRVLVKDQSTGANNGIYVVAAGAWSRSADANVSAEVTSGMYMWVAEGTVNGDNGFVLTTNDPITLGSTALVFTQFNGAGQIIDGNGLTKSGNTLSVNVDGVTIEINSDNLRRMALTGDVTSPAGSATTTIGANKVLTSMILDANVTLAKMANLAADTIIGRANGAGTGVPTALTATQVLTILQSGLDARYGQLAAANTWSLGQTISDGSSLLFTDPDVAHGMTSIAPTNQYANIRPLSGTAGGVYMYGLSDTDAIGMYFNAINGATSPTLPSMLFRADKKSGTGSGPLASTELAFVWDTFATRLMSLYGNGDLFMVNGSKLVAETIQAVDATGLVFKDDSGTTYLVLEDGGNVGIGGITNPNVNLHVQGAAAGQNIKIQQVNATNDYTRFVMHDSTDTYLFGFETGKGTHRHTFADAFVPADNYVAAYASANVPFYLGTSDLVRQTITGAGLFGFGRTSPQGKMHVHDATSGWMMVTKLAVDNVSQTVIPDGTGDVTMCITGFFMVHDGAGTVTNAFSMLNNSTQDVAVGGYTVRFTVSAAGAFSIARVSGTGSKNISFLIMWA